MRSVQRASRTGRDIAPRSSATTTPSSRVVCRPESRSRIEKMPAGERKRLNLRLIRRCEFGSIQDAINSIEKRGTSIYVLPGLYEERKYAGDERTYYCSHLGSASRTPLKSLGVHRQHLKPRGAGARRPGRQGRRDQPDRALVRRPGPVPAQPQPDRPLRRPDAEEQVDPLRQQVLRHPDRRHRAEDDRRNRSTTGSRSSTRSGWTGRAALLDEHDLPAGRVQLGLRAGDRRFRPRPARPPAATTSTASSRSPATTA